jgi:hypothetical protein
MIKSAIKLRPRGTNQGFALIVALSLMAFMLTLSVSMALLLHVETRAGSTAHAKLRAKEAARLALMMALGDLQQHAGPDQRVTARAGITGIKDNKRYWTGIWDTTAPSGSPEWLVSGNAPDPADELTTPMRLVGPGTVGPHEEAYVNVPAVEIEGPPGQPTTRIGWWVGDEGVKASLRLKDKTDKIADGFFTHSSPSALPIEEQRQILKQIAPQRHRAETLFGTSTGLVPEATEDILNPAVSEKVTESNRQLRRIVNRRNLPLTEGFDPDALASHFHDATFLAKAVLADTKSGGLKKDLSDRDFEDPSFTPPIDRALMDFLWARGPDANGDLALTGLSSSEIEQLEDGDPVPTVGPILTEVALYFAVSGQRVDSRTARAFLRLETEVWSPHGFRHDYFGASTESPSPELTLEFENLPDIDLSFYDRDSEAFTSSTTLSFDDLSPGFELDLTETHKAGEIRKTIGLWPANASSDQSNFYYTDDWEWTVDDPGYNKDHRRVDATEGDFIRYESLPAEINLVLKHIDGDILQKIENLPIDSIQTDFGYYKDSPSNLRSIDAPIAFYYRLYDQRTDLEAWLGTVDPRAIVKDLSESEQLALIDLNDVDGNDRGNPDQPSPNFFTAFDRFHGKNSLNFFRLYDSPAAIPYSLGALGHLQLFGARPFTIGNAWGSDLNRIFDTFFISGLPDDPDASYWTPQSNPADNPLPNPFVEVFDRDVSLKDISNAESARYLLNIGSFNINSTSTAAWLAVLAGNFLYDWDYTINQGTDSEETDKRINLEAAFFGLPFSGHYRSGSFISDWKFPFEDYEEESSVGDDYPDLSFDEAELTFRNSDDFNPVKDWRPSLQIGHREIDIDTLASLAETIVTKLEDRSRPFFSLSEFLNSGILQSSIDATSINTIDSSQSYDDADDAVKIPRLASAYLSQGDIFSAMAPFATARSDSFTIRARAETLHPVTREIIASANCAARVQRIPKRIAQDRDRMGNADGFGRQFTITNIQWLDDTEL